MAKLENVVKHDAICQRIEELLPLADDNTTWLIKKIPYLDLSRISII